MVFSSLVFLFIFLPLNLFLYFVSKNKTYRNIVLIVFSLVFYAWGEPVWIVLLIFSASIDYVNGRIIEKNRGNSKAKLALAFSIVANLLLLVIFKYSGFFFENINSLLGTSITVREFSLPIGISFYTFQTLSYTIDVYRGHIKAQQSYHKFLLFVSLFHQLVAGPIVRYSDIAEEIEDRTINYEKMYSGITRLIIGLAKKVLIANAAGELAARYLDGSFSGLSVTSAWFGIFLFALQIYFDFSGYSDMAIGLGRMFGFTYKENFNYPYIARSVTEFWRRWHISLGSFFRDYLYIPLGGNRKFHIRNLLIVWFLTGLWHGASWNFIAWGMFYGLFILLEKAVLGKVLEKVPGVFSHIYLVFLTLVGWVLFYFTDMGAAVGQLALMFGATPAPFFAKTMLIDLSNNSFFIVIAIAAATPFGKKIGEKALRKNEKAANLFYSIYTMIILLVSVASLVGAGYNPFLYFRF